MHFIDFLLLLSAIGKKTTAKSSAEHHNASSRIRACRTAKS